jgi:hypothetical protein
VHNVPSAFVFNLDEEGHNVFADAVSQFVVVKKGTPGPYYYPVKRSSDHCTFLACINAAGGYVKPMVVTKRKTIEVSLISKNLGPDKLYLAYSETGFITGNLFDEWLVDVFKPWVVQLRAEYRYNGVGAILLDGCTVHTTSMFTDTCADLNLQVYYLPPHSSNQTQPLDLGLFHIHKARIRRVKLDADDSLLVDRICAIYNSWQASATALNITRAWEAAGAIFTVGGPSNTIVKFGKIYASKVSSNDVNCKDIRRGLKEDLKKSFKVRLSVTEYNKLNSDQASSRSKGIIDKLKSIPVEQHVNVFAKLYECLIPLECVKPFIPDENYMKGRPKKTPIDSISDVDYGLLSLEDRTMYELESLELMPIQ